MQVKIQRSMRKSMALQVRNSQILVKVPFFVTKKTINDFLAKHKIWIEDKLSKQRKSLIDIDEIEEYKKRAREYIPGRVKYIAEMYGYKYKDIKITSAKSRWWSCTSQKNLNFSFRLILTPNEIIDYVIYHELSHLRQMNHSRQFWKEVSIMDKDYKKHDKWLKKNWDLFTY